MLSKSQKEHIWYLYESEQLSKAEISRRMELSRNTVIKVLNGVKPENEQLVNEIKKIKQEQTETLIKLVRDDNRLPNIVNKILNAIDDEQVIKDQLKLKDGIKALATVMGVLTDKNIATKRLVLDEKRLKVQEKLANLKEKELELRISNPETFQDVVIIDDADAMADYYKELDIKPDGSTS